MTAVAIALAAAGSGFALLAAGGRWRPATMSMRSWSPAVALGVVAGCGAAFLGPEATAAPEFDTALVGISVAVIVVLASRARAHWLVLAAAVVSVGAVGALPVGLAAGGLGGAAACALWPTRIGWPKSAAMGCTMVAAAHLDRSLPLGGPTALAVLGALIIAAAGHRNLRTIPRRRARIGVAVVMGFAAAAAACGLVALAGSRADLTAAADEAVAAAGAARAGDTTTATARFAVAATRFERAQRRLNGPLADVGSSVPVVAQHLRAGARLAAAGRRLSTAGRQISVAADDTTFKLSGGKADLVRIAGLSRPLADAEAAVAAASADTAAARSPWLVPAVTSGIDRLDRELARATRELASASAAATILPPMLGAESPQTYLVVLMAGAETRGSGGVAGSYATMTADGGSLRVDRVGRAGDINLAKPTNALHAPEDYVRRYGYLNPQTTFQNTNYTPDFPVAAKVMADLAGQALDRRFDGVVGLDPDGVAALLAVTGPVTVSSWPVPITAANAAQILNIDQYARYPLGERVEFLGEVAAALASRLGAERLGDPRAAVRALGPAAAARHLQVASFAPPIAAALERLNIDGGLHFDRQGLDVINITTSALPGSKLDAYLHRDTSIDLRVDTKGMVSGTVKVTIHNDAPTAGLPAYVVNSAFPGSANQHLVDLHTRLAVTGMTVNGLTVPVLSSQEAGGLSWYTKVDTAGGGGMSIIEFNVASVRPVRLPYRVQLVPQPLANVEQLRATIVGPGGSATIVGPLDRRRTVTVR